LPQASLGNKYLVVLFPGIESPEKLPGLREPLLEHSFAGVAELVDSASLVIALRLDLANHPQPFLCRLVPPPNWSAWLTRMSGHYSLLASAGVHILVASAGNFAGGWAAGGPMKGPTLAMSTGIYHAMWFMFYQLAAGLHLPLIPHLGGPILEQPTFVIAGAGRAVDD
jgi:hypothetical protein